MEELISVIVCTYNQAHTIGRTLDSILMQQCRLPVEIVIGEDCSSDATLAVCQDYARRFPSQIRLMANAHNKGIIDNYFDCLLAARGKYIADCAGDDFWTDPLKLEKERTLLDAHPDVVLVHTDWLYYDEASGQKRPHGERLYDQPFVDGSQLLEPILVQTRMPVVHLCTSLYRRDAFLRAYEQDTYVFRNKQFGCEDLSLTFMLARQGRVAYLPDVTLSYSVGHNSVSYSNDAARQFRFVRSISELTRYLSSKYEVGQAAVSCHLQQRLLALAMHAFRSHDPQLRDEASRLPAAWGIAQPLKARFVMIVMQWGWLWNFGLQMRRWVLSCKRVCR